MDNNEIIMNNYAFISVTVQLHTNHLIPDMMIDNVHHFADYDLCRTFWTAGQRAKPNHPTMSLVPLVWKLRPYVWQTMYYFKNWSMTGPSPSGDCLHVASIAVHNETSGLISGEWGTSPCETLRCVVCELPLTVID